MTKTEAIKKLKVEIALETGWSHRQVSVWLNNTTADFGFTKHKNGGWFWDSDALSRALSHFEAANFGECWWLPENREDVDWSCVDLIF